MATKWDVNNAVKASSMPPPRRLVMFVLSDVADPQTAVIPADRTPSLRELAEWTGLDKSTVTRHLDALDAEGWVIRDRPDLAAARRDHVRTSYRLDVPRQGAQNTMPEGVNETEETGMVQPAPSLNVQTGQGMVHSAPRHGAENTMGMVHSAPVPYTDEVLTIKTSSSSAKPPKAKRPPNPKPTPDPTPERPDVDRLCEHLAARIVANGCRPPTITAKWRTEARLLLDKDGKTEDQVMRCIDWATADSFWRSNILSMPKLRQKYDQLSLAAQRERANSRASPTSNGRGLVERGGMMLRPETAARLDDRARFEAMDAAQLAIEGTAAA